MRDPPRSSERPIETTEAEVMVPQIGIPIYPISQVSQMILTCVQILEFDNFSTCAHVFCCGDYQF